MAYLLKQEEPVTWNRLREDFADFFGGSEEAAERKWTRDKATLAEVGIHLEFFQPELGGEGGYVLRPESLQLRDLRLTADEAAVLWTAAIAAGRMREHPWRRHVLSACDKLRAACRNLPAQSQELKVHHSERADRAHLSQIVERIGEAVRRRKRVQVEYFSASRKEVTAREVDIYGFAWRRGTWLFAGHCHFRNEVRVFYVDHVRGLTVNEKRPAAADYAIPADFDIRVFSRQQPWEFRNHAPVPAEVRLSGSLAPLAGQLLPGGEVRPEPLGTGGEAVVVRLERVGNLHALARTVLSFGPEAELLSPERGRELARQMLRLLASRLPPGAQEERSA